MRRLTLALGVWLLASPVRASDPLPYTARQHAYNGFNTWAIGDIRTVGMAGATVGLGDTFLAASNNPAGCSMTLGILDTNITATGVHDGNLQNFDQVVEMRNSAGIAANLHPWGLILGFTPTGGEGQSYFLPGSAQGRFVGQPASVSTKAYELRLGASRVFFDNLLSLGASLNTGIADEEAALSQFDDFSEHHRAWALGAVFGAMVQLPERVLLGASYTLPMHYHFAPEASPVYPGFVQRLEVPDRLDVGIGWIPNRFLRTNAQLSLVGTTPDTALLADDTRLVGRRRTLQPKLGAAYIFMDYRNWKGIVFAGSYYEVSRIDGGANRIHETAGVEIKAWMVTAGIGVDHASRYRNILLSIGADLGFILERLRIVPTAARPPYVGMFPNPLALSDAGLARPLVKDWHPVGPDMDLVKIIKDLPDRTQESVKRLEEHIEALDRDASPSQQPPPPPPELPTGQPPPR